MDSFSTKAALVSTLIIFLVGFQIEASISEDDLLEIKRTCDKKVNLKSIGEFRGFIKQLHELFDSSSESKLLESNGPLSKCFQDREALIKLDQLIADYDLVRPCKYKEIAKLEAYAKKHFTNKKRPISLKFFTLFGVNVGYHCNKNLMAHVKQADDEADQLDFIYSMASPTGWDVLINEHTKKSMKFGVSTNAANEVPSRIAKLVPGLLTVADLSYMDFANLKSQVPANDWQGIETELYSFEDQSVGEKIRASLERTIESCQNLDQLYVNNILSLARLNSLGLLVGFDQFTNHHERSAMVHKWLAAASFCQLMVRVSIRAPEDQANTSLELGILHDEQRIESRRRLYSYVAEFDEIHEEAVHKSWLASVPEGNWLKQEQAMFNPKSADPERSTAMKQLSQYIKGLERDLRRASEE